MMSDPEGSSEAVGEANTDNQVGEFDPAVVQELANGFLAHFLTDAKEAESRISELTHSQNVLIEAIQHENAKFSECKEYDQLNDMMLQAKKYHSKLVYLKKEMSAMQDKSHRLKKRALELQQQKQKKLLQLEQQREREMERERQLTAKTVQKPGAL